MEAQDEDDSRDAATLAADLRGVIGRLRRRLRAEGSAGDLTAAQKTVLRHLERHDAATVSTLARIEGVRPQSMGATVSSLEAAGLVIGTPDPADGRQTLLRLTEACRNHLAASRAARQDWLTAALLLRLSAAEREKLAEALPFLDRLAEP